MTNTEKKELERIHSVIGKKTTKGVLLQLKKKYPERKTLIFDDEKIGKDFVWKCRKTLWK